MAKLWKRIKNWIIKKLGGFTQDEFAPTTRYEFIPTQKDVITLCAEGECAYPYTPPAEFVKDMLCQELSKQLRPHVKWQRCDDYFSGTHIIRATVRVVDDNG